MIFDKDKLYNHLFGKTIFWSGEKSREINHNLMLDR